VQYNFNDRYFHSEVHIIVLSNSLSQTKVHVQCALIQNTFTYIAIQFLLAKGLSALEATSDELTDQWPIQVYVASFLTLLNMRYYLRSEYSDTADIPQINHLSLLRAASRRSRAEQLEESQKLSQHSHENDELYPARPDQALTSKVRSCIIVPT